MNTSTQTKTQIDPDYDEPDFDKLCDSDDE